MLTVDTAADLAPHAGQEVGVSEWHTITSEMVQQFAALTGERHWIHTDADRVRRETSYGGLVAHGFLTLSLLTRLAGECVAIRTATRILNYGLDRLRFTDVVVAGARVRLRLKLERIEPDSRGGTRLTWGGTVEVEGKTRPALVTDFIWAIVPEGQ
jgi:acyl dehydratase